MILIYILLIFLFNFISLGKIEDKNRNLVIIVFSLLSIAIPFISFSTKESIDSLLNLARYTELLTVILLFTAAIYKLYNLINEEKSNNLYLENKYNFLFLSLVPLCGTEVAPLIILAFVTVYMVNVNVSLLKIDFRALICFFLICLFQYDFMYDQEVISTLCIVLTILLVIKNNIFITTLNFYVLSLAETKMNIQVLIILTIINILILLKNILTKDHLDSFQEKVKSIYYLDKITIYIENKIDTVLEVNTTHKTLQKLKPRKRKKIQYYIESDFVENIIILNAIFFISIVIGVSSVN